jgi:hypothetical protein
MAVTVSVKGVFTWLIATLTEWAFGSVHGAVPEGQFTVATCETFVPGEKVIGTVVVVGGAADAMPDKLTFCWDPAKPEELSVKVTLAVRVPTANGWNVT